MAKKGFAGTARSYERGIQTQWLRKLILDVRAEFTDDLLTIAPPDAV